MLLIWVQKKRGNQLIISIIIMWYIISSMMSIVFFPTLSHFPNKTAKQMKFHSKFSRYFFHGLSYGWSFPFYDQKRKIYCTSWVETILLTPIYVMALICYNQDSFFSIASNKFGYNKHPLVTSSFPWIFKLVVNSPVIDLILL